VVSIYGHPDSVDFDSRFGLDETAEKSQDNKKEKDLKSPLPSFNRHSVSMGGYEKIQMVNF